MLIVCCYSLIKLCGRVLSKNTRTLFSPSNVQFGYISIQKLSNLSLLLNVWSISPSVLEMESPVINWSEEITEQLGSRIYPLWNRSAGDCLLDSVLQASYGVFDRDNTLRRALYDSLTEGGSR